MSDCCTVALSSALYSLVYNGRYVWANIAKRQGERAVCGVAEFWGLKMKKALAIALAMTGLAGTAYAADYNEANLRAFYRTWLHAMQSEQLSEFRT